MMVPSGAAAHEIPRGIQGLGSQPSNQPDWWCNNLPDWAIEWLGAQCSTVAPPPSPTGDALVKPPVDGAAAQALVDQMVNKQLTDQQKLNAQGVKSTWVDETLGNTYQAGKTFEDYLPYIVAGGAVVLVLLIKEK